VSRLQDEDSPLKTVRLVATSPEVIDGGYPELVVSCSEGGQSIFLDLVRKPGSPPPLREIFAQFSFDGAAPKRFEMGSLYPGSKWSPRTHLDEGGLSYAQEQQLAGAIVGARQVRVEGFSGYAPTPVTWAIELTDSERRRLADACVKPSPAEHAAGEQR
jgi:hypothetical protein